MVHYANNTVKTPQRLKIAGCPHPCTLAEFAVTFQDLLTSNYKQACELSTSWINEFDHNSYISYVLCLLCLRFWWSNRHQLRPQFISIAEDSFIAFSARIEFVFYKLWCPSSLQNRIDKSLPYIIAILNFQEVRNRKHSHRCTCEIVTCLYLFHRFVIFLCSNSINIIRIYRVTFRLPIFVDTTEDITFQLVFKCRYKDDNRITRNPQADPVASP